MRTNPFTLFALPKFGFQMDATAAEVLVAEVVWTYTVTSAAFPNCFAEENRINLDLRNAAVVDKID